MCKPFANRSKLLSSFDTCTFLYFNSNSLLGWLILFLLLRINTKIIKLFYMSHIKIHKIQFFFVVAFFTRIRLVLSGFDSLFAFNTINILAYFIHVNRSCSISNKTPSKRKNRDLTSIYVQCKMFESLW